MDVYLEIGRKRVFAGAIEWPGWCRNGRDEGSALETLAAYAARYRTALGPAARGFKDDGEDLRVVERLKGDATTDFGAPGIPPSADERSLDPAELKRQTKLLRASWAAFDAAAKRHARATLRKGPRGGGRELDAIVKHVLEAEGAYLHRLGDSSRPSSMKAVRDAFVEMLEMRAAGETPPMGRRTAPLWTLRYAIRRSAWHALDHAWEIEDRAG